MKHEDDDESEERPEWDWLKEVVTTRLTLKVFLMIL